ncbi:hypothetical protein J6590_035440 [Homalodisca vitripennis]|nr:hypothetical protein J6590_035440 [Homalodisca vitripennis]
MFDGGAWPRVTQTERSRTSSLPAKKPSLTRDLGTNGLKVSSEPPPMAGQADQGRDRGHPSKQQARSTLFELQAVTTTIQSTVTPTTTTPPRRTTGPIKYKLYGPSPRTVVNSPGHDSIKPMSVVTAKYYDTSTTRLWLLNFPFNIQQILGVYWREEDSN